MIIDLTHTITPEMPMYPGSAAPSIKPTGSLTRDGFRETQLTIASHTGTHMDAPSHMLPRGSTLEVLAAAPEDIRLGLFDQVAGLRLQWCTAAFARGLQLGLALGVEQGQAPHYRSR